MLGDALRSQLHEIIGGQNQLEYYAQLPVLWRETEADAQRPGNILLLYSGVSVSGADGSGNWNREHVWPQSYGAGTGSAFSDAHHLYPVHPFVNSERSNFIFDEVAFGQSVPNAPGSLYDEARKMFEPRDEDKGRVARAMLYMDLRYESGDPEGNLRLSDFTSSQYRRMGRLSTLLQWHRQFPPDERENRRNHIIHNGFFANNRLIRQGNRNPFVDFPELADALHTYDEFLSWGSWRIQHFSFSELLNETVSGPTADPDGDRIANLAEFVFGMNPRSAVKSEAPELKPAFPTSILTFPRPKEADKSYIEIGIEYFNKSGFWQSLALGEVEVATEDLGLLEEVTISFDEIDQIGQNTHFRLVLMRNPPSDIPSEFIYDPSVIFEGGPPLSIFAQAPLINDGPWRESAWMGFVVDEAFPYVYHTQHHWLYFAESGQSQLYHYYDPVLGWMLTTQSVYPLLYSFRFSEWVYFLSNTTAPDRYFYFFSEEEYFTESELTE
jgi:endonuclease I